MFRILVTLLCLIIPTVNAGEFAETTATITSSKAKDANFDVKISYHADESIALDANKKPIKNIEQVWVDKREPVSGQKIRIKYKIDEPIIFELIDKIKYVE